MTVDMKSVRVGDTLHFRCGGSAKIAGFSDNTVRGFILDGHPGLVLSFLNNGMWLTSTQHPLDIIRVTPRALTPEERLAKIAEIAVTEFQYLNPNGAAGRILRLARGEL